MDGAQLKHVEVIYKIDTISKVFISANTDNDISVIA